MYLGYLFALMHSTAACCSFQVKAVNRLPLMGNKTPGTQHDQPNDSCDQPNVPVKTEQASGEGGREWGVDRGRSQTRLLSDIMMG